MLRTTLTLALIHATVVLAQPTSVDQASAILSKALAARTPDTRKQAVRAIAMVGGQEPFAGRLESMLKDRDVPVRLAVIDALAEQRSDRAARAMEAALDDQVPEVRFAAAKALFQLHDEAGKKALLAVLNDHAKTSSGLVAGQIRESIRLLQTPRQLLTLAVRQGIGMAPVPYLDLGMSAIEKIRSGKGESDRAATALLLGPEKDPGVAAALQNALGAKDSKLRTAAAAALAMRDDPAYSADLRKLLNDKDESVRLHAAAGFLRLGNLSASGDRN